MNDRDRDLILEIKRRLSSDLADHVKRLIVFGSRATGGAAEDSDLDVITLVDDKTPPFRTGFAGTAKKRVDRERWQTSYHTLS